MIKLAEEFFQTKNDPAQISISETSIRKLRAIHPSTMAERTSRGGPVAWVIVIPTTSRLMREFIAGDLTEQELLDQTPLHETYDALYLCSALVLPEHRRKGYARALVSNTIKSIQKEHPIKYLFCWTFSTAGSRLADSIAAKLRLPLFKRKSD